MKAVFLAQYYVFGWMPAFKLNGPGKQQIVGEKKQEGYQSYHCYLSEKGMF